MDNPVVRVGNSFPRITLTVFIFLAASCTPASPTAAPQPIRVQYSFATQPWLPKLNQCAGKDFVVPELRSADIQDPHNADLVMRIGQPDSLTTPGYQIGKDELMVIVNPKNPVNKLATDQVRGIFSGRIQGWQTINGTGNPIQVWVFFAGEDVQQIFQQSVMGGSLVTSQARLANSPDEMALAISKNPYSIGLITRQWKADGAKDVLTVASGLPVLAITQSTPKGVLAQILACLEK